jgi:hypothetical protein
MQPVAAKGLKNQSINQSINHRGFLAGTHRRVHEGQKPTVGYPWAGKEVGNPTQTCAWRGLVLKVHIITIHFLLEFCALTIRLVKSYYNIPYITSGRSLVSRTWYLSHLSFWYWGKVMCSKYC